MKTPRTTKQFDDLKSWYYTLVPVGQGEGGGREMVSKGAWGGPQPQTKDGSPRDSKRTRLWKKSAEFWKVCATQH